MINWGRCSSPLIIPGRCPSLPLLLSLGLTSRHLRNPCDRDDGFERPDPAEDPGRGAGQGHGRRREVPGPTLGGATPAGPDSSGGHGIGLPGGLRRAAEAQPRRDRPVPRGQEVQRGRRCPTKKLTREYKATLNKAERKAFRAEMWAFRRDPESLTPEEQQALGGLFLK